MNKKQIKEYMDMHLTHTHMVMMNLSDRIDNLEDKVKQSNCLHPPECIKFDRGTHQPVKKCIMCGKIIKFYNHNGEYNTSKIEWYAQEIKRLKEDIDGKK